jgi:hypothetical protein
MISVITNDYEIVEELPDELLELSNDSKTEANSLELLMDKSLKNSNVNNQLQINNLPAKPKIN